MELYSRIILGPGPAFKNAVADINAEERIIGTSYVETYNICEQLESRVDCVFETFLNEHRKRTLTHGKS